MLRDYLAPNLEIIFIGLNPGLYSAKTGHHFARPTNLFWAALYESGLVTERLKPEDDARMMDFGYGMTNIVARATNNIDALSPAEFVQGGKVLRRKLLRYAPRIGCFVGITGYRIAYDKRAQFGLQSSSPAWGNTKLFIVPSTSPRNAFYRPKIIDWFKRLKAYHDTLIQ